MADGPPDPSGEPNDSRAKPSKHKERRSNAASSIEKDRIRAWEKLALQHGPTYCDSPEAPPGYKEWYQDKTRRAAERSRRSHEYRGGTPSTSASAGGGSVPPTPDYYSNDTGIPFPVEQHWENGGYGYEDPYTGGPVPYPRGGHAQAPAPASGPAAALAAGSQLAGGTGVTVDQGMVNRLFESVIRSNERSADMAATAFDRAFERRESYRGRGGFQFSRRGRGGRFGKQELTREEADKLRLRLDCRIVGFEAGGKPPILSNRELDAITAEQQKRIADENARRARAAEQGAIAPGSQATPIVVSDADASGEDEVMRDETVVPEGPNQPAVEPQTPAE